jgi:chorismate mutase
MENERSSRMRVLAERLQSIDRSLSRLTAERLKVLAEIAKLDAEDGASERQTASRVARLSSSTPKQAAGEIAMAKQISALPGIADAHAKGEISNGQLGAIAEIASGSSEDEALAMAKSATSSQLQKRASACRGKLFEERRKAQATRYLAFKPEEGGQSTRIHGRLPFAESRELETQLRKIADRLGLCNKERPSPSARMADALLILTKSSASQALHDHQEQASTDGTGGRTERADTASTGGPGPNDSARPKLYALTSLRSPTSKLVIDYDEEPFPEIEPNTFDSFGTRTSGSFEPELSHDRWSDASGSLSDSADGQSLTAENAGGVVVQRADTRVIIHWNAQSGEVNYENGPPIDHPRLLALLCDARIDVQHCDPNGLPTGLITSAHHSSWRQDRYLAFRDGPCRVPECQGIGKTQAHHIFEDRIDRVTSVEYMINFCNRCHQEHHDGIFSISGDPEQTIMFTYKSGDTLTSTARPLPKSVKPPKPQSLSKHNQEPFGLFPKSA